MIDCKVCDGETVVAVGTGAGVDLVDCPVCVGRRRETLTGAEIEDVVSMCKSEGVEPKWLPPRLAVAE